MNTPQDGSKTAKILYPTVKTFKMKHASSRRRFSFNNTSHDDLHVGLQNRCDESVILLMQPTRSVSSDFHSISSE